MCFHSALTPGCDSLEISRGQRYERSWIGVQPFLTATIVSRFSSSLQRSEVGSLRKLAQRQIIRNDRETIETGGDRPKHFTRATMLAPLDVPSQSCLFVATFSRISTLRHEAHLSGSQQRKKKRMNLFASLCCLVKTLADESQYQRDLTCSGKKPACVQNVVVV